MYHATYFNQFLKEQVNMPQWRLDLLSDRVDSVYFALQNDETLGPLIVDKIPQGSWPHRTIIRPKTNGEFDADFLLLLSENPDWDGNPSWYPNELYAALGRNTTYAAMPHGRRTHCVYLTYAAVDIGCHLDIVPYVELADGRRFIIDRKTNKWEFTDPVGFTTWIRGRDDLTNGNFRKVVRLMKYYKVHRGSFSGVPSIILTTLLGEQVNAISAIDPATYGNVPKTLVKIVTDLSAWLQANPYKPTIWNPSGDLTTFDHRWEQPTYSNFRDRMKKCAETMAEASEEADPEKSMKLWQDIFGDTFQPVAASSSSASTSSKFGGTEAAALGAFQSRSGRSG